MCFSVKNEIHLFAELTVTLTRSTTKNYRTTVKEIEIMEYNGNARRVLLK